MSGSIGVSQLLKAMHTIVLDFSVASRDKVLLPWGRIT